jgi:hypothetical protein
LNTPSRPGSPKAPAAYNVSGFCGSTTSE